MIKNEYLLAPLCGLLVIALNIGFTPIVKIPTIIFALLLLANCSIGIVKGLKGEKKK